MKNYLVTLHFPLRFTNDGSLAPVVLQVELQAGSKEAAVHAATKPVWYEAEPGSFRPRRSIYIVEVIEQQAQAVS